MMATFDALYKGDPDKLHRAVEIMQSLIESDESTVWEDGILYINSYDPDTDFLSVGFQCFTEQAYKDKFGL